MNDPSGMFVGADGLYHLYYQCQLRQLLLLVKVYYLVLVTTYTFGVMRGTTTSALTLLRECSVSNWYASVTPVNQAQNSLSACPAPVLH